MRGKNGCHAFRSIHADVVNKNLDIRTLRQEKAIFYFLLSYSIVTLPYNSTF